MKYESLNEGIREQERKEAEDRQKEKKVVKGKQRTPAKNPE